MSLWSQSIVLSLLQHRMFMFEFEFLVDFKIGDKAGGVLGGGYIVVDSESV